METYPIKDHPGYELTVGPIWEMATITGPDGNTVHPDNDGRYALPDHTGIVLHRRCLRAWAYLADIPRDGFEIPDFPGYTLDVNRYGEWVVRSWRYASRCRDRWPGHPIAEVPHAIDGRPILNLRDAANCNRRLQLAVIVLIAHGHMPDPSAGKVYACHNNGDPYDNQLDNLRWDTPEANAADRERHEVERDAALGYDPNEIY